MTGIRSHRWRRVAGAGVVALLASACGGGTSSTGASPTAGAAHAATPSAAAVSPTAAPTAASGAIPTATASPGTGSGPAAVAAELLPNSVPAPRYRTMGAASGTDVYLLGGLDARGVSSADVYRIMPPTGQTSLAGHLATPTHGAAAVTVGNQILVFGGADVSPDNQVQAYDPASGVTSVIGHMPAARADLVAAAVGGRVYLLAGFTGSSFVTDVWDTTDGRTFSVLGPIGQVERYPAVAAVGTTIYLFGGLVAGGEYNGTYSDVIQSFDTATGRSAVLGHLPVAVGHARAAVVGGQVLVFGGWTSAGASSAVLRFDPATGSASAAGSLPLAVADEAIGSFATATYFASGLGAGQRPLVQIGWLRLIP